MIFMFKKCAADFPLALAHFSNLTELELFGGSFYDHKITELLETKGFHLRTLTLTSVKQIDYKGWCKITKYLSLNKSLYKYSIRARV